MPGRHEINRRILNEIDNLEAKKDTKEFLKELLSYELDIIDQGSPRFSDSYEEIFNRIFS